jgi:hypothetical protein
MRLCLLVLWFAALSAPALAEPLPVLSVSHAQSTPRLDASLDDPTWKNAATINGLLPPLTPEGKPPLPLYTQVLAQWDADYLYVRFICDDSEIYTPFTERDAFHYQGDVSEVFLDPVGDGRQYFEFQLSPRGGILDQYIVLSDPPIYNEWGRLTTECKERSYWANLAWNCDGLKTASRLIERDGHAVGWVSEFALPAKSVLKRLGKTQFTPQTLRANFMRYDWPQDKAGKRELIQANWSPVLLGCPHISATRMGFLQLQAAAVDPVAK